MVNRNIEEVSRDKNTVTLQVLGVKLVFAKKPDGNIKLVSKTKEAQVYDSDACWVPKNLFRAACWEARSILKHQTQTRQSQEEAIEETIFKELNLYRWH